MESGGRKLAGDKWREAGIIEGAAERRLLKEEREEGKERV